MADESDDHKNLIKGWVQKWKEDAHKQGSKIEFTYAKALKSLRECEEPVRCGSDCKKLKGFGDKICASIDKKLKEHFGPGFAIPEPQSTKKRKPKATPSKALQRNIDNLELRMDVLRSPSLNSPLRKVTKYSRAFIPSEGTSGFAILVSLLRYEFEFHKLLVNKLDLEKMAHHYSNTSQFQKFTVGNSLKTLLSRELVSKTDGRSSYYSLTEDGKALAISIAKASTLLSDFCENYLAPAMTTLQSAVESVADSQDSGFASQTSQTRPVPRPIIFEPASYDLILYIDSRERYSTSSVSENRAVFATALAQRGVKAEIRTLPLGDFVWIAREKLPDTVTSGYDSQGSNVPTTSANGPIRELVLDIIIERKRIDDLASSIKDKRWEEQKSRLKKCGIRRPIYLVEYTGKQSRKQDQAGVPWERLEQAMSNAEIDGFDIKRTNSFDETIRYLTFTHQWLERTYARKRIMSVPTREALLATVPSDYCYITFNEFATNSGKSKTYTTQEMFLHNLLILKGISFPKAKAILEKFPTLNMLMEAYEKACDLYSKHNLVRDLVVGSTNGQTRKIGPVISKKLSFLYTTL